MTPLYEFGFGLSYTTFTVSNLHLDSTTMSPNGHVTATVQVKNTGTRAGDDVVASIVQPVRRLRGFQRVTLAPNESRRLTFTLGRDDVGFYDNTGKFVVEPGAIDVFRTTARAEASSRRSA